MRNVPSPCGAMTWLSQILSNRVRGWAMRVLPYQAVSVRLLPRSAPRDDDPFAVIASEAKQSRSASRTATGLGVGVGGRTGRGALAAGVLAPALGDARRFAPAAAQVIELGAAHVAAAHHLDRGDARRMQWEDALDAFAVGDLAQREVRVDPGILA